MYVSRKGVGAVGCCEGKGLGLYTSENPFSTSPFTLPGGLAPNGGGVLPWLQLIPEVVSAFQDIAGGDGGGDACWTGYDNRPFSEPCPNTPNYDAVARAVEKAPTADITKLIGYLLGGNQGRGPKSRADLARPECIPFWVKAILGGKDCRASRIPDAPPFFLKLVATYGAPDTADGGSWLPSLPGSDGVVSGSLLPILAAGVALFFIPKILGKG